MLQSSAFCMHHRLTMLLTFEVKLNPKTDALLGSFWFGLPQRPLQRDPLTTSNFGVSAACLVWFYLLSCQILFPKGPVILLPYGWGQNIFPCFKCGYRHSLRLMAIFGSFQVQHRTLATHPQPLPPLPLRPSPSPWSIFSLQHGTCLLVIHQ